MVLFGIDGAMMYFVKRFAKEGLIPNIAGLMKEGVLAEALPCHPCDTPTNWTTLATGTTTASHGVTSFYLHIPGENLATGQHYRNRSALSKHCLSGYLWDHAAKRGMRSLVLNYPVGWPPRSKRVAMVCGWWGIPGVDRRQVGGWTRPRKLGPEIVRHVAGRGRKLAAPQLAKMGYELFESKGDFLSRQKHQADVLADIMKYLGRSWGWELAFFHYHLLDGVNHRYLGAMHPEHPSYSRKGQAEALKVYRRAYRIVDELCGRVLEECADEETLFVFVSDHAALPCWKYVSIPRILVDAGLLHYKWDKSRRTFAVDWSKTTAYPYVEPPYVWVNLKGRDPEGVVRRGREYESARERIMEALTQFRDTEGGYPVALAVRREDARMLGAGGERAGDVVFCINPSYTLYDGDFRELRFDEVDAELLSGSAVRPAEEVGGYHAGYLPTCRVGDFMVDSVLIMRGPGVKQGKELERPIQLADVVPTAAHLLRLPMQAQYEGRVLWEALE